LSNCVAAQVAAAAGVPVLLDAGGVDAPLSAELLQHLTIISPNETELQRLTGLPTGSEQELLKAAAALQQRAAEQSKQQQQQGVGLQVLLKLGTAGSMMVPAAAAAAAAAEGQVVRQPAIRAPQVVDTTGKTPRASLGPKDRHVTLTDMFRIQYDVVI
jgi:ribokinase